jgi:polysaccharide biosynthesis transport protein
MLQRIQLYDSAGRAPMAYENVTPLRDMPQTRPARPADNSPALGLREQFRKLRRRKWIILGTILAITTLAVVQVERLIPQYRAAAQVMLDVRRQQAIDIKSVLPDVPVDLETVQGEIAVITSRTLAEKVVTKLGLDTMAEFNPRLAAMDAQGGFDVVGQVRGAIVAALEMVGIAPTEAPPTDTDADRENRTRVVNAVLANLDAAPRGRSRVIEIGFTSGNAERAAMIANTFADLYILERLEAKFEAAQRANQWLNERMADLRLQTEDAERRAQDFRQQAGLLQGAGTTTLAQAAIGQFNAELISARAARATADARLRAAEPALGAGVASLPGAVLENGLIQRLQEQVITLQRRQAELGQALGPRHPQAQQVRADLDEAQGRLRAEINKVISGLRNDASAARSREQQLESELRKFETQAGVLGQREVELRTLDAQAQSNRALLSQLTQRLNETALQQDLQQPDARVISTAPVPQVAAFPNKRLLVSAAFVLATLLGVALALILEHLDQGFRSAEQVTRLAGVPSLGLIPALGGLVNRLRRGRPADTILDRPRSNYAEAVSSTVASLFLAANDRRPKLVLVTSTLPGEGKTTLTASLARAAAQSGLRVLLVDADLRRPALNRVLGLPVQPGLTDVLTDRAAFVDAVQKDPRSTVAFLPAGNQVQNPLHLLASERTRQFLHGLGKHYDLILIDSSPVMAVSDPRILSRYVDQTVFVVRWARTPREQALNALAQIVEAGGRVAGVVLSMVDVRRHAQYGFGDSGQYHLAGKYYQG